LTAALEKICGRPPTPPAAWIHQIHAAGGASGSTTICAFCAVSSGCPHSSYVDKYKRITLRWGCGCYKVGHPGLYHTLNGMMQACVAHFVTPLKRRQGVSDRQVTNQKLQKKHKSPSKHHHHGGVAAHPSSGMDLMNPCHLRGGRHCACSFRCRG